MKLMKLSALSVLLLAAACNVYPDYDLGSNFFKSSADQNIVRAASSGSAVHSSSGDCVHVGSAFEFSPCNDEAPIASADVSAKVVAEAVHDVPAPVKVQEDQTIYFDFNKASLSPEMIARLDALAVKLKSTASVKHVRVVGYADRLGGVAHNLSLSQQRADNVLQYLVAKGVAKIDKAKVRWTGSSEAKAKCPTNLSHAELINCLKSDRRVEVEVVDGIGSTAPVTGAVKSTPAHNKAPHAHKHHGGTHKVLNK